MLTSARYLTRRCHQDTLNGGWQMQTRSSRDDLPALQQWQFTHEDAARITQPVLNLSGTNTKTYFKEIHETVRTWLPHAEHSELADATHAMLQTNPKGAAERVGR